VLGDIFGGDMPGNNDGGSRGRNLNLLIRKKLLEFFAGRRNIDIHAQVETAGAFRSSQINREISPGARPFTNTWVGVTTSASATLGSVTDTRFSRSSY